MKQILQNLNSGETVLEDVPVPHCVPGSLLIRTRKTLVSAGTERMLVDFGKGNLLQKAQQQPDKVRQVLEKVKTDGVIPTVDAVRNKLDTPLPLGYCNVGTVAESGVSEFAVGDRVASNGKHAEYVLVPQNLCVKIPNTVDDESAAFTVIGAIALQGIRLIRPTLGETVVVTGLGLIGLVAVQLLRAHGCRVLGIDMDPEKLAVAGQLGAETVNISDGQDPLAIAEQFSRGRGVDAVLITASTKSNTPIHQAATMCRKRGRIVLVGVVGMEMSRADFYEKEISFQVSCSYGPGRYDPDYEEKGQDYPYPYVRWTEQRNFEAILDMMADGRLDMQPLISHRYRLDQATEAYELISAGKPLGVVLDYPDQPEDAAANLVRTLSIGDSRGNVGSPGIAVSSTRASLGFIGAGNYASAVLVPAFAKTSAELRAVASATGVSSVQVAKKHGVAVASTDSEALLNDHAINALVITTRHNSHAQWVRKALACGKHVFVEKPLTLTRTELDSLETWTAEQPTLPLLMVGFNRRYSPLITPLKQALLQAAEPCAMTMTINAGNIPADHWTQDRAIGGGRIIGEACHFVDLLRFLAGSPIETIRATAMDSRCMDTVLLQIRFANGSIGSLHYLANGTKAIPKERLEVFCAGGIAQLDNFRALKSHQFRGLRSQRLLRQDKGQTHCAAAFVNAIESGDGSGLIPRHELFEVARAIFDADDQLRG
ncbi:MAG: bi-domain-containing oxidoreductase [Pseudomonadota bacterium]